MKRDERHYFAQTNEFNQPCIYHVEFGWIATCISMNIAEWIANKLNHSIAQLKVIGL